MVEPVSGMFFIPEVYEWIDAELPGYEGLRVYIRVNLRNFERQEFIRARIDGRAGTVRALEMAIPWIKDWNVYEADADGNPVKVAPPAEQGMDAYMRLDPKVAGWLLDAIQMAFLGGKESSGSPVRSEAKPEPLPEQSAAEPPAPKPKTRRSRPNSTTPDPSPMPA